MVRCGLRDPQKFLDASIAWTLSFTAIGNDIFDDHHTKFLTLSVRKTARFLLRIHFTQKPKSMKQNPVVHFEMPYEDSDRLTKFYSEAFGWQMQKFGPEMGDYVTAGTTETDENRMVKTPGAINGGFYPKKAPGAAPHPSVVISVDDINDAMKRVRDAGGNILGEPVEIPGVCHYVSFTDTEGNRASLLQPLNM